MATNRSEGSPKHRRDSIHSTALLWEKFYERIPEGQQDAPFATDQNYDANEQSPALEDYEESDADLDASPSAATSLSSFPPTEQSRPWENPTQQESLTIIINDLEDSDQIKSSLRNDLSKQGLKWKDAKEEERPWHLGLTGIHLEFTKAQWIDISMLILSSRIPFWLKLKTEKQKPIPKDNKSKNQRFTNYNLI